MPADRVKKELVDADGTLPYKASKRANTGAPKKTDGALWGKDQDIIVFTALLPFILAARSAIAKEPLLEQWHGNGGSKINNHITSILKDWEEHLCGAKGGRVEKVIQEAKGKKGTGKVKEEE